MLTGEDVMDTLQHDKIKALCGELRLADVAKSYLNLAQQAADKDWSHSDFLEAVLNAEREARRTRTQATLTRMAGFPTIKTLAEFDFAFATGVPNRKIKELASLAFVEHRANVIFLGP